MLIPLLSPRGMAQSEADPNPSTSVPASNKVVAQFDKLFDWTVGDTVNSASLTGVAWFRDTVYISRWNADTIFRLTSSGSYIDQFFVPGVSNIRSITTDGVDLYFGNATQNIYKVNPNTQTLTSTITLNTGAVDSRMCAYDPNANSGAGGFWLGDFSNGLALVAKTGGAPIFSLTATQLNVAGIYGGAVDTFSAGGPYLWIYAQSGTAPANNVLHQFDIAAGATTGLTYDLNLAIAPDLAIAGGAFITDAAVTGKVAILCMNQLTPNRLVALELAVSDYSFEIFSPGDFIAVEDSSWSTWSVAPGTSEDALVSSTQAQSGTNSLELSLSTTDALFLMGDQTTGVFETGFSIYVPTGNSAYYNIQNDETAGVAWMIDGWFDDNGTGYYEVGVANQVGTFTYAMDTWTDVRHYIDLDNDSIQVFVGGTFVYAGAYTANATNPSSQLGAYDFWPSGGNATGKTHYIDDMVFQPGTLQPINQLPVSDYTFEIFSAGDFIAVVDSSWNTWSGAPGTGEDALVSSTFAQSGTKSLELSLSSTDAVFEMGDATTGVWETGFSVYVETGQSAYYNIQETEVPGTCWVVEVNFDDGGTGSQTLNSNTFSYPMDTWVDVRHFIDLDNDSIQLWIDGVGVAATKYSANGCNVKLGGYDFFPAGGNGPGIRHYIDDMVYQSGSMPVWSGLKDRFTLDFQMFPNPAENNVTIINTYNGEIIIRIKDAVGRTHQTMNSNLGTISIDVSELTSGIYFVEIQHQDSRGISKLIIK
jgi:Secretion system C-terminal sorting domain